MDILHSFSLSFLLLILSLFFWLLYCISIYCIFHHLTRYMDRVSQSSFSFFHIPRYLNEYRKLTRQEKGRTGLPYYFFYASALLLLVTASMSLLTF